MDRQEIERDELIRFSIRFQAAKRVAGTLLVGGLLLLAVSALVFAGFNRPMARIYEHLFGIAPLQFNLLMIFFLGSLKCFLIGILLPFWLGILLARKWVERRLGS